MTLPAIIIADLVDIFAKFLFAVGYLLQKLAVNDHEAEMQAQDSQEEQLGRNKEDEYMNSDRLAQAKKKPNEGSPLKAMGRPKWILGFCILGVGSLT